VDHRQNPLYMGPGSNLGHHAAEAFVQPVLRGDYRGEYFELVGNDSGSRLIARRFNGEDF
jgi:hypothetical protein